MNAMQFIDSIRARYLALSEDGVNHADAMKFLVAFAHDLQTYQDAADAAALEVESMKQVHHDDSRIQSLACKYSMTTNQVFGLMDSCDKLNNSTLSGSGMVVVPFWFHEQYVELKNTNEVLTSEASSLVETVNRVSSTPTEDLSAYLPERQSIITGLQTPYIAGVTGPRVGDEHLDRDNVYPNAVRP
jgi:hypothetical protein